MGDSNYGGNGSIHWSIDHQDRQGLTIRRNDAARPKHGGRSNVHANKGKLQGRDPRADAEFRRHAALRTAAEPKSDRQLTKALEEAESAEGGFFVKFRVPATVNKQQRKKPGEKPWPDVRVQW